MQVLLLINGEGMSYLLTFVSEVEVIIYKLASCGGTEHLVVGVQLGPYGFVQFAVVKDTIVA